MVLTLDTTFNLGDDNGGRTANNLSGWGDLLLVKSKAAEATHAYTVKQLRSLGAETWHEEHARYTAMAITDEGSFFKEMKPGVPYPKALSVYCFTIDGAGDETKVRNRASFLVAPIPWVLFFDLCCLLHQLQRICRTSLKQVDLFCQLFEVPGTYYGSLATLSNTMREYASDLRTTVLDWFKDDPEFSEIKKRWSRIAPRCLSGRWGCVWKFEEYAMARPFPLIARLFEHIFRNKSEKFDGAAANRDRDPAAESTLDDSKNCIAKLGKWRKKSVEVVNSKRFRFILELVRPVHQILSHIFFFFCKRVHTPMVHCWNSL